MSDSAAGAAQDASLSVIERVLAVEGMHCAGCAAAVEARLRRQPGVIEVAVNFTADSAVLRWEASSTSFSRLQRVVARLGYRLRDPDTSEAADAEVDPLRRSLQWRLAVAIFFGMWSMMPSLLIYLAPLGLVEPEVTWPLAIAAGVLATPVILYSGSHFYRVGWRTLRAGVPGLDTLIGTAVMAASLVSIWHLLHGSADVYFDAAVMLITFQLLARLIDSGVRRRASAIIRGYLSLTPEEVRIWQNGAWRPMATGRVTAGERLRLQAGEELALDGRILTGEGEMDLSFLSGETAPRPVGQNDRLEAGCRLLTGELELCVTAGVGARRLDAIARSVRALLSRKSALQHLADRLARWLLPLILAAATLTVGLGITQGQPPDRLVVNGLAVLIIACPCALSLAIPLVVVLGHARLVTLGILFRDSAALEAAAATQVVIFDKTGTLTTGTPSLASAEPAGTISSMALRQ
ncbi:MAG TPA: HAD-IC family P-type ATPase, partial [Halomonas sp.]|nr:HAD-IC family P-type ATPase [Halomonas sp.]